MKKLGWGLRFGIIIPEKAINTVANMVKYFEDNGCNVVEIFDDVATVSSTKGDPDYEERVKIFILEIENMLWVPVKIMMELHLKEQDAVCPWMYAAYQD